MKKLIIVGAILLTEMGYAKTFSGKKETISLMVGFSRTRIEIENNPGYFLIKKSFEPDVGVLYQRKITDNTRASFCTTIRNNTYVGIGLDF